jgi:hypothetical protein
MSTVDISVICIDINYLVADVHEKLTFGVAAVAKAVLAESAMPVIASEQLYLQ